MGYPDKQVQTVDGVRVEVKSFKRNLYVFKSIGGVVKLRSGNRGRQRTDAEVIRISNTYYSRVDGTPYLVSSASHSKECRNSATCKLRHAAGGIGVKLRFPGGGASPAGVPDLLPLDGVITRAEVRIGSQLLTFTTAKGSHPG